MGRVYKELVPNCHLVFVYDAGHGIARNGPKPSPMSSWISLNGMARL